MNRSLLQRAVANDLEATPGYLVEEIVRLSFSINDSSNYLLDFFLQGLKYNNKEYDAFVKLKHLRLIRRLCEEGCITFREALARRVSEIKPFLSYSAPLDPLRGDAPVREVRQEAERCLKSLYGPESSAGSHKPRLYTYVDDSQEKYPRPINNNNNNHNNSNTNSRILGFGNSETSDLYKPSTFHQSTNFNTTTTIYNNCLSSSNTPTQQIHRKPTRLDGFGNPHFQKYNDGVTPSRSTLSDAVTAQAESIAAGLSHAAITVSKYLPSQVKTKLESFATSQASSACSSDVYRPQHYSGRFPNNNYSNGGSGFYNCPTLNSQWPLPKIQGVDLTNRFRFSNLADSSISAPIERGDSLTREESLSKESMSREPLTSESFSRGESLSREIPDILSHKMAEKSSTSSPSEKLATHHHKSSTLFNEYDLRASALLLIEALESTCASRNLPSTNVLFAFTKAARQHPIKSDVIQILLWKLVPKASPYSVASSSYLDDCNVIPATSWHVKVNVVTVLTALLNPEFIPDELTRFEYKSQIQSLASDVLDNLKKTSSRCRPAIIQLENAMDILNDFNIDSQLNQTKQRQHQTSTNIDLLDDVDFLIKKTENEAESPDDISKPATSSDKQLSHIKASNNGTSLFTGLSLVRQSSCKQTANFLDEMSSNSANQCPLGDIMSLIEMPPSNNESTSTLPEPLLLTNNVKTIKDEAGSGGAALDDINVLIRSLSPQSSKTKTNTERSTGLFNFVK